MSQNLEQKYSVSPNQTCHQNPEPELKPNDQSEINTKIHDLIDQQIEEYVCQAHFLSTKHQQLDDFRISFLPGILLERIENEIQNSFYSSIQNSSLITTDQPIHRFQSQNSRYDPLSMSSIEANISQMSTEIQSISVQKQISQLENLSSVIESLELEEQPRGFKQVFSITEYVKDMQRVEMLQTKWSNKDYLKQIFQNFISKQNKFSLVKMFTTELDLPFVKKIEIQNQALSSKEMMILAKNGFMFQNLIVLNLSRNQIGINGMRALTQNSKHFSKLKRIILSSNQIGDEGVKTFTEAQFPNLKVLKLCQNKITKLGFTYLVSRAFQYPKLSTLSFDFNNVKDSGVKQLVKNANNLKNLKKIQLKGNCIKNKGLKRILKNLNYFSNLKTINFQTNNITQKGIKYIRKYGNHIKNIKYIYLAQNLFQKQDLKDLLEINHKQILEKIYTN